MLEMMVQLFPTTELAFVVVIYISKNELNQAAVLFHKFQKDTAMGIRIKPKVQNQIILKLL